MQYSPLNCCGARFTGLRATTQYLKTTDRFGRMGHDLSSCENQMRELQCAAGGGSHHGADVVMFTGLPEVILKCLVLIKESFSHIQLHDNCALSFSGAPAPQ